ncbi:MAG TPA: UDP binding domain-containing protein, partial [Bacteroidales bacterium]
GEPISKEEIHSLITVHTEPYETLKDAHAIAVLTEWDEFRAYDWNKIYKDMYKPAFVFDGRNILDAKQLREIGFEVKRIGK